MSQSPNSRIGCKLPRQVIHTARTAAINARTFAASFFPGADSTPLETSTANGRTFFTAPATFSSVKSKLDF